MSVTIESLELQLNTNSTSAANGLDLLSTSLSKLKNSIKGGLGLNAAISQLKNLDTTLNGISDQTTTSKIDKLANSLSKLSNLSKIKISSSIGKQLSIINSSLNGVNISRSSSLEKLSNSIKPLSEISKAEGIRALVMQLSKLPSIIQKLEGSNTDAALGKITKFTDYLANIGNKNGFIGLNKLGKEIPVSINGISSASSKGTGFFEKFNTGAMDMWAKFDLIKQVARSTIDFIGQFVNESNSYIENINLFQVSMGKYADEAQRYAEKVSEILGIDPGEFMRNQGVFMTISEGFGIASDRAYKMSKNLTQLGYDISSFFNIPIENAMQKLTSGISGELEPLRRLGYDLSQARLKADALSLGIRKSFNEMTQAEKAQLRYHAIMTQVTKVQGDMARTLSAPANQLRILSAQVKMAARAIGNVFIPVLNLVLPFLIAFFKIVRTIGDLISGLLGFKLPTIDTSAISAGSSAMGDLVDNTKNVGGGIDDANKKIKEMKNAVLGIDELNIISDDTQDSLDKMKNGIGDIGSGMGGAGFDLPEYDFLGGLLESNIATFEAYLSSFMLVLGTILVLTGANIPIGLALMAMGAVGLVSSVANNWNTMSDELAKNLALITIMLGTFFFALGVFMLISGNIPMGIALMVAGFASIGTSVAINFGKLKGDLGTCLQQIMGVISGFMFAIGTILLLAGPQFVPYGIALLVAGVVTFITAANVNWTSTLDLIKKAIGKFGEPVGMIAFTIGLLIAFSGVGLPIGIALMVAGATSIISSVAINWNSTGNTIKDAIGNFGKPVGMIAFVIGLLLAFTGAGLPIGIALMVAGAGSFIAGISPDWGSIGKYIGGALKGIVDIAKNILGKIGKIAGDIAKGVFDGAKNIVKGAVDIAGGIGNGIKNTVGGVINAGKNVGKGLLDGIGNAFNGVKSFVNNKIINPLTDAIGNSKTPNIPVKVTDNAPQWWVNTKDWFKKNTKDKLNVTSNVKLQKDNWSTVAGWIGKIPTIAQGIDLSKTNWTTVKNWIGNIPVLPQGIALSKDKWSTVAGWVGKIPSLSQAIGLSKDKWSTVAGWIGNMPTLWQGISLTKHNWRSVSDWIGYAWRYAGIALERHGWSTVSDFIGKFLGGAVTMGLQLVGIGKHADGGYYNESGFHMFESGGYINSKGNKSFWKSIPRYASGTTKVGGHGSLFIAGEAGAEMVGHINGQTEVLNQSQIKLAMKSAVISGMLQFTGYWRAINMQIANASNAVIRAVLMNTQAINSSSNALYSYDTSGISKIAYDDAVSNFSNSDDNALYDTMRNLFLEHIEPSMKEIAEHTKRQADKDEKTIVRIGNREITSAVDTQRRANGYSFYE